MFRVLGVIGAGNITANTPRNDSRGVLWQHGAAIAYAMVSTVSLLAKGVTMSFPPW